MYDIISDNVPPLGEVANFVTVYFPLKIKFLAKRERELIRKFAIARNRCYMMPVFLSCFATVFPSCYIFFSAFYLCNSEWHKYKSDSYKYKSDGNKYKWMLNKYKYDKQKYKCGTHLYHYETYIYACGNNKYK